MYIKRVLEDKIKEHLFKGKVIIVYGPRQAGKTTLVKQLVSGFTPDSVLYLDCELLATNDLLTRRNTEEIFSLVKGYKIVIFDEAQMVKGIGSVLKSLFDHKPEIQYIATGSSSFDLANEVSEPLTGRSIEYTLYPFSLVELASGQLDFESRLSSMMRFGGYPGIQQETENERIALLNSLVSQYLFKNVLTIDGFRRPDLVVSLLKLLAFQIGNEVSYTELAKKLGASIATIQKYITLLELNYIIIRIGAYSQNKRLEVVKSKKIYFVDLGLRNSLVNNFSPIQTTARDDIGALFENCMIIERLKQVSSNRGTILQQYFWRTVDKKEIDYIESIFGSDGNKLKAFEFKWGNEVRKIPKTFMGHYPNITFEVITPRNFQDFIG
jgi:predicted AAA+ superfamily ATPase